MKRVFMEKQQQCGKIDAARYGKIRGKSCCGGVGGEFRPEDGGLIFLGRLLLWADKGRRYRLSVVLGFKGFVTTYDAARSHVFASGGLCAGNDIDMYVRLLFVFKNRVLDFGTFRDPSLYGDYSRYPCSVLCTEA